MPDLPPLPPIAGQPLSVVLLAHNEEPHLEAVVGEWAALLDGLGRDYELILVDDGSSDRTGEMAQALTAQLGRLRVLRHAEHRGAGAALRTGLAEARQPLFFYTTCDRQYEPADLKRLLAEIDKVHLISGFRRWQPVPLGLRGLGVAYRVLLRVFFGFAPEPLPGWLGGREHLYRALVRAVFAVRLQDIACAFRLFRRELFARMPIQSEGDFVHAEVLAKANFLGAYMSDEVPIAYHPRPRTAEEETAARHQLRKDFRRVLSHPDFGPAVLPQPEG
jgi:glycosyltransferase involved in cell wall biosynthesis